MKQKLFRNAAILVLGTSLLLTGCGTDNGTASGATDGTEPVVLTWYYPDDVGPHTDIMWEELNAYLREKINVEIDYNIISWGEYTTKTNAIKSSGQEFDLMFESGSYASSVNQGAAYPITDLINTVGTEMKEAIPESIWKAATINGDIYGVPTYKDSAAVWGIIYNKTIADEAGIEIPESIDLTAESLDAFYRDAKEKIDAHYGPDNEIVITNPFELSMPKEQLSHRVAVTNITADPTFANREEGEVFSIFGEPETLEYFQMVRGLVEDGIYPLDGSNFQEDPHKVDGTLFSRFGMGYVDFPLHGWSDDYETAYLPIDNTYMTTNNATFGTTIVGSNSQNAEKAVEFLNLLNTDNFVANTIRFGVEGDYYNKTEDNRLDFTGTLNEDPSARAHYKWYGWQYGNIFAMSLPAQEDDALFDDLKAANEKALPGDHIGFVLDTTDIVNEIAAYENVRAKYENNLVFGMMDDVEGTLAQMNEELEAAGSQRIIDEVQSQVNEWRAENGLSVFGQ